MTHKILTVDDHPETLRAVVDTLEEYGYQVLSSLSPFKGLEIAEAELPDLILLDVNMPGMDGYEFARRLRQKKQLDHIPIIMFTAEHLPEQKIAGFDAGADDYLLKPTDPDVLIGRIQAILGQPPVQESVNEPQTPVIANAIDNVVDNSPAPCQGKVIALVGAHGGAGTTTLAFNLALALAESGMNTILIDYDLRQGHVAIHLHLKDFSRTLNQFARQQPASANHVYQNLVDYAENLRLLLAEPDPLGQTLPPNPEQVAILLQTLVEDGCCVIIDLGCRLDTAVHPVIERADEIYVCMQPSRVGLASARYLLHKLEKELVFDAQLAAIGFNVGFNNIRTGPIEQYLKRPLIAMLTLHPKEIAISINQTKPLIHMDQSPAGETIRQIAHKITSR